MNAQFECYKKENGTYTAMVQIDDNFATLPNVEFRDVVRLLNSYLAVDGNLPITVKPTNIDSSKTRLLESLVESYRK